MEDIDSQPQNVGPLSTNSISVGTYVSIKKNKQNLQRMYEKIHSNHESYRKNQANIENVNEVKTFIRGIVELIENCNQHESAELMRICIFMSNMILCVDSNYRDDFISSSKNIFQVLGQYFSQISDISSSNSNTENAAGNNNSQNHEYQTLVFIYKLLMATRHPSENVCAPKKGSAASQNPADVQKEKDTVITMREKLISKDFMRKIFEIDVEEFAPSENLVAEMWKMLLAFYTLFAKNKDKIAQFGLIRNAKDRFLEAIFRLHELSKSDSTSLHQAVGCLNYTLDKIKLSLKEIQKYNLVPVLCDLLESPRTLTQQLHVILKMFLNLSKQNLLSKNSYQTMCLGKAFKVFERAPAHAAELIADIYKKDPVSLKDITLQSAVALLRGSTQKWNEVTMFKRSQQIHILSHMNPQNVQIKRMLADIEGELKYLLPLISQMMNLEVFKNMLTSGDLDLILYPLLNSIEIGSPSQSGSSSQFALSQSSSLSSNQSEHSDLSNFAKIEAEEMSFQQDQQQQQQQRQQQQQQQIDSSISSANRSFLEQQTISFLFSQQKNIDQLSSNVPEMIFKPQDLKLYENILLFVDQCLILLQQQQQSNKLNNQSHSSPNLVPLSSTSSLPQSQQEKNLKTKVEFQNETMNNNFPINNIPIQPNISGNEYQKIMLSKLASLHFPDVLRTILNILQSKYSKLQSQGILARLNQESLASLRQFVPIVQLCQKLLSYFICPQASSNTACMFQSPSKVNNIHHAAMNEKKVDDCMIKTEDIEESLDNEHETTRTSSPTSSSLKNCNIPLRV